MIDSATLDRLLADYLPRQRWYEAGSGDASRARVVEFEVWRDEWPGLVWAIVEVPTSEPTADLSAAVEHYQLFVGLRSVDSYEHFLDGKGRGLLGDVNTAHGEALAYDALVDPELVLEVMHRVDPAAGGSSVRPLNVEQSNTSMVIDDRWMLKVFRRPKPGANPDVEVPERIWRAGFRSIPQPLGSWRRGEVDLAVTREFLAGATDGFVLAQTSLRDLCSSRLTPSQSGGDFAPEARRLGEVTAELHVALAEAFGVEPIDPSRLAARLRAEVDQVTVPGISRDELSSAVGVVGQLTDLGVATRIHGDFHLAQVMRNSDGWFVLDFEGEPSRPLADRVQPSSVLRDLAGMMRSLHYVTEIALSERDAAEVDDELRDLVAAWEARSRRALLEGYASVPGANALGPADHLAWHRLIWAFQVAKATYEVGYEQHHRPDLVHVPLSALRTLLAARS